MSRAQTESAVAPPRAMTEAGLPFFDVFEPRDYQGHTQVWNAAEDAAGILYFGNFGGVITFDGARWGRIDLPDTSFVRALAVDSDDTLWLGGVDELGYARTDDSGRRTFVSLKRHLPDEARSFGDVWRVLATPKGPVFQTNTWLFRWNGDRFLTFRLPQAGPWQIAGAGSTIWISHADAGWYQLHDDGSSLSIQPYPRPAEFAGSSLLFAVPTETPGTFLVGTSHAGLARWNRQTFVPLRTEVDDVLKQRRLYRGTHLSDGRIVVTTLQAGAFILDEQGHLLARLDEAAGLPDNGAFTPFAARDDALWLCLQRGVVRVDARPWLSWFGPARGAPRTTLQPPIEFHGELYVCTDGGLLRLAPSEAGQPTRLVPVPELSAEVYGLTRVDDDTLIAYGDSGIFEWRGGEPKKLPGQGNNSFGFQPAIGQPGRWFALTNGEVHTYRRHNHEWVAEGAIPSLARVRSLAPEANGTWWMGTPNDGLLRVTFPHATETSPGEPEITRFTAGHGLPEGHGWVRVSTDAGGPLLRCEKGFFRLDARTQAFVPTAEFGKRFADGTTTTRSMINDATRDGRWIVARPAGQAELVTTLDVGVVRDSSWQSLYLPHLGRIDDVSELHYEPAADLLWLAGQSGLVRVDLALWRAHPPPPPPTLYLRRAETNTGQRLPLAGRWELPFAEHSVSLRFAAPALAADQDARYESTLTGVGRALVQTDAQPQREYSGLSSGHYTLTLRARASNGPWSAPLSLAFVVHPPWWLSVWAWVGYVVCGALFFAILLWFRTRALRRRNEQLEAIVADRTRELEKLRQLEIDEKIAAKLGEEKARLEVLRYQLNPHFLFNALTAVCAHLPPNLPQARANIEQLVDFCQLTLFRPSGGDLPTVAQEAKMLRAYLDIEQSRWADLLRVELTIAPDTEHEKIPPLLLLPLVENALKYGRATANGTVTIQVRAHRDPTGALILEIANTGDWVDAPDRGNVPSLGIGLENLRQRLQRYYPGHHAFTHTADGGWVRASVRLSAPARSL